MKFTFATIALIAATQAVQVNKDFAEGYQKGESMGESIQVNNHKTGFDTINFKKDKPLSLAQTATAPPPFIGRPALTNEVFGEKEHWEKFVRKNIQHLEKQAWKANTRLPYSSYVQVDE